MDELLIILHCVAYAIVLSALVLLLVPLVIVDALLLRLVFGGRPIVPKPKPPRPGRVQLRVLREGDNGMLTFILVLPGKSADDVVSRELTVSVGGADPVMVTLAGDTVNSQEMAGEQGAAISGSLVDIDDAGNRSPARDFSFTLQDTIAPPQPGDVGIVVTSES